jgi:hypothetical protein
MGRSQNRDQNYTRLDSLTARARSVAKLSWSDEFSRLSTGISVSAGAWPLAWTLPIMDHTKIHANQKYANPLIVELLIFVSLPPTSAAEHHRAVFTNFKSLQFASIVPLQSKEKERGKDIKSANLIMGENIKSKIKSKSSRGGEEKKR